MYIKNKLGGQSSRCRGAGEVEKKTYYNERYTKMEENSENMNEQPLNEKESKSPTPQNVHHTASYVWQ